MLASARVDETPKDEGVVDAGMEVTVKFGGDDDTETFLLGAREVLALDASVDLSVYSPQSPLGSAILGKMPGDSATFRAPNGRKVGRDRGSQAVHRRPLTATGHKRTRDRAKTNARRAKRAPSLPRSRCLGVRRR